MEVKCSFYPDILRDNPSLEMDFAPGRKVEEGHTEDCLHSRQLARGPDERVESPYRDKGCR